MANMRKIFAKKLEGFSLIEVSMVLLIVGIIAGAMLKGKDLIDAAQIKSVASDIQNLQIAYANYVNSYGSIPGDDNLAKSRFGDVENGDGDGKISSDDAKKIFSHLYAAGFIESKNFKTPKIGGTYEVISDENSFKLKISNNGNPFITGKQLISLKAKVAELIGDNKGNIESDPTDVSLDTSKKYIVKIKID